MSSQRLRVTPRPIQHQVLSMERPVRPSELPADRPARTARIDPSEGFGVASLPLELGILDPGRGHQHRSYAGGWDLRVGRRTSFPVMFGLGGGVMFFASSSDNGPRVTSFHGGSLSISSTSVQRTIELRHAELIAHRARSTLVGTRAPVRGARARSRRLVARLLLE
jgi:hypothetical protein